MLGEKIKCSEMIHPLVEKESKCMLLLQNAHLHVATTWVCSEKALNLGYVYALIP